MDDGTWIGRNSMGPTIRGVKDVKLWRAMISLVLKWHGKQKNFFFNLLLYLIYKLNFVAACQLRDVLDTRLADHDLSILHD